MIELYSFATPNGQKVHIGLEELGLPYTVHAVDISKGEQFAPSFLAITPNHRIPAIIDTDRIAPADAADRGGAGDHVRRGAAHGALIKAKALRDPREGK